MSNQQGLIDRNVSRDVGVSIVVVYGPTGDVYEVAASADHPTGRGGRPGPIMRQSLFRSDSRWGKGDNHGGPNEKLCGNRSGARRPFQIR